MLSMVETTLRGYERLAATPDGFAEYLSRHLTPGDTDD